MDIESFQKSFKNNEINIKFYLLVVSILFSIILIIIGFNNNIEDYYVTQGIVNKENVKIIVDINNMDKITKNKKLKIGRDIFTYKILKIEDNVYNNNIYKEITINVENLSSNILIDNNVIELKIIINKTSALNYLIKTIKGE